MDELQTSLYGFDFRGPASSEALNHFAENAKRDLGGLLYEAARLKSETTLLAGQTRKQTLAMARKLAALSSRDTGSVCVADLTDPSVLLTTDRDDETIPTDQRLVHRSEFPVIMSPTTSTDWLSNADGDNRYVADGVGMSVEVVYESGTTYYIPTELAISGHNALFFERILAAGSPLGTNPEISVFFSVPPTRTGIGYPNTNYLSYFPFPIRTTSTRVYYTTDSEPTLTRAGAVWNDWESYVDDLRHSGSYVTEVPPIFSSFPTKQMTAVRFDLKQPFYLVEDSNYIYSYGLGMVRLGLLKSTASTAIGTVRIDKPSGTFTSVTDSSVELANIAAADESSVASTYEWVDPGDASIAYVEITVNSSSVADGQVPIITEVSVDYT